MKGEKKRGEKDKVPQDGAWRGWVGRGEREKRGRKGGREGKGEKRKEGNGRK